MKKSTVLIMAVILLLIATLLIQALPMEQSRLQDGIDTYSEKDWLVRLEGGGQNWETEMKGERIYNPDNKKVYLSKKLEENGKNDLYLMILTSNQEYKVYIDGVEYDEELDKDELESTSGNRLTLIPLAEAAEGKEITIMLDTSTGLKAENAPIVYMGTKAQLVLNMVTAQLPIFTMAVIQFAVGITLLIFYIVSNALYSLRKKTVLYLSLLTICLSFWLISESYIWGIMYNNNAFFFILENVCRLLISILFLLAVYHFLPSSENRPVLILIYVLAGMLLFAMIGQLTQVFDFSHSYQYAIFSIIGQTVVLLVVLVRAVLHKAGVQYLILLVAVLLTPVSIVITIFQSGVRIDRFDIALPVAAVISVLTTLTIISLSKAHQEMIMTYSIRRQMTVQTEYCRNLEKMNDEMELFRHDAKNHMLVLGQFLRDDKIEEAKSYAALTAGAYANREDLLATGNLVLDSLLTEKMRMAKELGIDMQLELLIPKEIPVPLAYWIVLMGNIMDNAIEACERSEKTQRFISVRIRMEGNVLFGSIANTSDDDKIIRRGDSMQTTKKDKRFHGRGMLAIRWAVEQYDGALEYEQKDGVFTLSFTLYGIDCDSRDGGLPNI